MSVRATGLVKSFGAMRALDGIDLDAAAGQIVAITGSNGAGKTTLLRVLSTVLRADAGTASVAGFDVDTHAHDVRRAIGVALVSDRGLYWRLSGLENIEFFARLWNIPKVDIPKRDIPKSDMRARAMAALAALEIDHIARHQVMRYSTGQRQRLVLARAIVTDPKVLLIDEPMRGLDDDGIATVRALLRARANAGATVLVAAPTTDHLDDIADVTYVLEHGHVKERHVAPLQVARR